MKTPRRIFRYKAIQDSNLLPQAVLSSIRINSYLFPGMLPATPSELNIRLNFNRKTEQTIKMQPLLLYVHGPSPNPVKVAILLEELELPYDTKTLDFATELKAEPYISINPNGRVPALEDPNTGVKMFEVYGASF